MIINGYEIKDGANLRGAGLSEANLSRANLSWADLSSANLSEANLSWANLSRADLSEANLSRANLSWADLSRADLSGANLRGADLSGADLSEANLIGATLPAYQIPAGDLVAWKKADGRIVELLIPSRAKRTACLVSRKCRAEFAFVRAIEGAAQVESEQGCIYRIGEEVWPDRYCDDPRVGCSHGIHFFVTRQEAEEWQSS